MPSTMHIHNTNIHRPTTGKLPGQRLATTSLTGPNNKSPLFFVTDRPTGTRFLVDTGADVSVIPSSLSEKRNPSPIILQAVNNSPIPTYDEKSIALDLGLRRKIRWIFLIADVPVANFGADFLASFGLKVDMRHMKFIDTNTNFSINGISCSYNSPFPMFYLLTTT